MTRNTYHFWFTYTDEDRTFSRNRGEYTEGLPSVARRLKAEMEPIADPDEALRQHPDWFVLRFPNGEWMFGYGYDSHGFRVGHGTLVVKDSRGQVRVFFGHVCGTNACLDSYSPHYWKSLDDFYKDWWMSGGPLREWVPPP